MDQARDLDKDRLQKTMETTRVAISSTVGEIREKVGETLDWRHQVNRHPGASLTVAVAAGLMAGRAVASMIGPRTGDARWREAAGVRSSIQGEAVLDRSVGRAIPESGAAHASGPRRAVGESWGRLGARTESIVNRLIDEVADAVEGAVVPALGAWVRERLDFGPESRRQGWVEGDDRPGRAGVYPGGPAGRQYYPPHGPTQRPAQGRAVE